jgi:SagB-type dehydrogenase family enzyme
MTLVKSAGCAVLFWQDGKLVWDDYLRHEQFALTARSERVVRWFADWRELESVRGLGEHEYLVADRLLDAGVLIRRDSPQDLAERRVLAEWADFGTAARYFHFAARTDTSSPYLDLDADRERTAARVRADPPPPVAKTYPDHPLVPLNAGPVTDERWPRPTLLDAVNARRSARRFSADSIPLSLLGDLLRLTAGVMESIDDGELGPALFKSSPSAGARTPAEIYVYADRVAGLDRGLYHYAPTRDGLEAIGPAVPRELRLSAVGGQPWLADGAALLIHTAVIERTRWRYRSRRAYRDILLELGHVSQTMLLSAGAMGLGAVFATALKDVEIERLIGCDFAAELPLGVTSIGFPAP